MRREPHADELARLASLERLLQRMVAIDGGPQAIEALQKGNFTGFDLDPRDAAALGTTDVRKLDVYRKLVRGTFVESARLEFPLAAARLGALYHEYVHEFCRAELPRSPILRDVAFELVAFALPLWHADPRVPPWLGDLARFELLDFAVHSAEQDPTPPASEELPADRPVRFDGSCRLGRFDWSVHDLPDDPNDKSEPERAPTALLLYRDRKNEVRRLTLTPLAARIVELLLIERLALGEAVRTACAREHRTLDSSVIEGISTVLADLGERGAVLGADDPNRPEKERAWLGWLYDARAPLPIAWVR
jgi:hypothetical protein